MPADKKINGEQLECVSQFKYLGSTITEDSRSIAEIKIRIATATSVLAKLKPMWRDKKKTSQ